MCVPFTFKDVKPYFEALIADVSQAETVLESENIVSSRYHAKAVYCALQFNRLFRKTEAKISLCEKGKDWHFFTFFSWLNSELLVRQTFRNAMIEILEVAESGYEPAVLLRNVVKKLVALAERMRHIQDLGVAEAHYSTIALIKLNRLLELRNFEQPTDYIYEDFHMGNLDESSDVRIEHTRPQAKATAPDQEVVDMQLAKWRQCLELLREQLSKLKESLYESCCNSLCYARLWGEIFGGEPYSFGVESYILKCENEVRDFQAHAEKLTVLERYVGKLSEAIHTVEAESPAQRKATSTLLLQQVGAAIHLTLAAVLQLSSHRFHDLVGEELVQKFQRAREPSLKNKLKISWSPKRYEKGIRMMSQIASNLKTANGDNTRGTKNSHARFPIPAATSEGLHGDITQEYYEAMKFTSRLIFEKAPNSALLELPSPSTCTGFG